MCGIAGKISINTSVQITDKELTKLVDGISHRGPDSRGIKSFGHVGFGHARLAIVDLTSAGHQPMSYDRGNYWITFNGEIYNFLSIRKKLEKKGYSFVSKTDTEVILAAYKAYGEACVNHLRGMFSFAIYDKKQQKLFAARDRLGKKPFKYFYNGKTFIFASELKTLLHQKEVKAQPDRLAIEQYLYWGFVPSPLTGFSTIRKLPPAHTLTLDITTGAIKISPYWKVPVPHVPDISYSDAKKKLRSLVFSAVQDRLMSDVPLGAFLSGGIDSAIIVGAMSHFMLEPVQTFTIGFPDWENDERILAAYTAKKFGTLHLSTELKPNVKELLPEIIEAYEEPFGDSSGMPSFLVSKLARKNVTVALNGDGGDENFFGYSNYTTNTTTKKLSFLRFPAKLIHNGMLSLIQDGWKSSTLEQRIQRISHLLGLPETESYALYARGYLNGFSWEDLIKKPQTSPTAEIQRYLNDSSLRDPNMLSYIDFQSTLPDGLMPKIDIASMHYGLECRSPFLDHRIVEFSSSLPLKYKFDGITTKKILRETFSDLLPPEIISQPKKGFNAPVNTWLQDEFSPLFQELVHDKNNPLFDVLDYNTVHHMILLHKKGSVDFSTHLWRIITLQLWFKRYFANTITV